MHEDTRPLSDVTVVDCSQGVAGAHAGRLLADLGARVIKVEPPGGDRLRRLGPFPGDVEDLERGGLHLALNAGKESTVIALDTADGAARLSELLAGADIFIESDGQTAMRQRGLAQAQVAETHPALVYVSHSPFGQTGPYAGRVSSEIVDYAMGGYMYFSGAPDRHPLLLPGYQAEFHAGMQIAAGAVIALWHARATGAGQHVDVSTLESSLNAHSWLTTMWTHLGQVLGRVPSVMIPVADGHIFWMPVPNPQLFILIDRPDLIDDPRWNTMASWAEAAPQVREMVAEWAADKPKQQIYRDAQELRIAITPVNTMQDLAESPQLGARSWWRAVGDGADGEVEVPGPPWYLSESETGPRGAAPKLGSAGELRLEPRNGTPPRPESTDAQPFAGLRVIEVTANWAGPLAGRHFGDMGADVIKIELARRPATRGLHHAGGQLWNYHYNRAGYFNLFNRNKRDLVLDLGTPEGHDLFLRLVDQADIVLENNSARVFEHLGLSYPVLQARNPRIIMCSISGMGATGPERHYVAYGSNIEASSGLASQLGYSDGLPFGTGSYYADPIAGTNAAIVMTAALLERERTGKGQFIDMALQESGMIFNTEAIMDYRLNGRVAGPSDNQSQRFAPQGAYPSVGIDCWLAIGVETDVQWGELARVIGRGDLADTYPTVSDRLAAREEIDAAIAEWSQRYDHQEATRILQSVGVPAGPVLANWEIVSDPHLYARNYFVDIVQAEVGHYRWDGYPWKMSRTPGRIRQAPVLFGEHNDEVLGGLLGLSQEEIAALREATIVADAPIV